MTTIVTRAGKGSPLTHTEVDTNFTNLNTNKLETAAIPLGTAAAPSVSFVSDANTGIFSPGADQVAISTNGTGRLFVDATGVITQTKSSAIILVLGAAAGQVSATGTISIASEGQGVGADTRSGFMFRGRNTAGTLVDILELSGATGATVTKSLGVGAATPSTSGAGITFPATQSASTDANTLDDYEEGTWTPSLGGTATYTTQAGQYTKVGRLVYVSFQLDVNLIGTGSNSRVSGLPFTSSFSGQNLPVGSFGTTSSTLNFITGRVISNQVYSYGNSAAGTGISEIGVFQNSTQFYASGYYLI